MRITMSSKQYTMLQLVLKQRVFTQVDATSYLQPTFSSMARRGWLATELDSSGEIIFTATPQATNDVAQFKSEDVYRTNQSGSLSRWLDGYVKRSQRRKGAA